MADSIDELSAVTEDSLQPILSSLTAIIRGDCTVRLPVDRDDSKVAAIHAAINVIAEELGRKMRLSGQILRSMVDAVIVCDGEGTIRTVNDAACRLLGLDWQQLVDRQLTAIFSATDDTTATRTMDASQRLLQRIWSEGRIQDLDLLFHHSDGTQIPMQVNASVIQAKDQAPDGVLLVARDTRELREALAKASREAAASQARATELEAAYAELARIQRATRETQAKTIQSSKLAALGELAAGVAHEMNNPLSGVVSYAVLLQEKLDEVRPQIGVALDDFDEYLRLIRSSADRCKAIADNLLTFARQADAEMAPLSIADTVRDTFQLIGAILRRKRIVLDTAVDPDLLLLGNASQVQQVVTNIILNAIQVMDMGGKLTLRTSADPDWIKLEISDTGPGIPEEHLTKIFDPFFTTKPIGMGTGLGLSIAYGIVQAHGGELWAISNPDAGATFTIRLPRLPADSAAGASTAPEER